MCIKEQFLRKRCRIGSKLKFVLFLLKIGWFTKRKGDAFFSE